MEQISHPHELRPPSTVHLVGIGGIGMSGLAQLLKVSGYQVSGSDRALNQIENEALFNALKAQGIQLFPQDGSYIQSVRPNYFIYSTAIESNNPDFLEAPEIPQIHRSEALQTALLQYPAHTRIAVTGSAGKTTTSAWLGEVMNQLQLKPTILSGGIINRFKTSNLVGNFVQDDGDFFIFEADESDKSITRYHPEITLLLNVGTDHYKREELLEVFAQVLKQTKVAAIIESEVLEELPFDCYQHLKIKTFSIKSNANFKLTHYAKNPNGCEIEINHQYRCHLPLPGTHNAANALAILAVLSIFHIPMESALSALSQFTGVWRRFEKIGSHDSGARVYDDYAHNVEKICSAIRSAHEIMEDTGRLMIFFQPHGFGPLKFMKDELPKQLLLTLNERDQFFMLPVFYAGGTTSFRPTSEEVVTEIKSQYPDLNCFFCESRDSAEQQINQEIQKEDLVLILGARDNSLALWAKKIAKSS